MKKAKTVDSIPIDLFLEIFSRLPTKSVGRCRCVSKLWSSILSRQEFTELFLTKSLTRPRLLFALERYTSGEWFFYSSPHPQNPYEKSTVVAVDFHIKFPRSPTKCSYAYGLFYFPDVWISKNKGEDSVPVICNPITGQYAILPKPISPKLSTKREPISFFGFDPIEKQFKVLLIHTVVNNETVHHILTLGAGKMRWRNIQCPLAHYPAREGICINGVLYYLAQQTNRKSYAIVCFDVRTEKFKLIDAKCFGDQYGIKLINYKGKVCGVRLKYKNGSEWKSGRHIRKLCMWVLEDVEKQEWSQYVYPFPKNGYRNRLFIVGMTTTCEIVLSESLGSKPYNVCYFSPERNTLQCVNFQGVEGNLEEFKHFGKLYAFVDHVEDLSVNNAKQLMSSLFDLRNLGFQSINKFDALCPLDDD
ncbi:F-box domain [Arabidopsis suecica]|uniref:F-box domain n=1 Tax=Arabidopsis suecica TaxID=45249 RepID=A0A8T2CMN0_ARASU|nr:F-box domain [Arabidopsis suecica]